MNFKGTQTEWQVYGNQKTEIVDVNGKWIADAGVSIDMTIEEKQANAKLISASKELLSACIRAREDIINMTADFDTTEILMKAIKKAL